MRHSRRLMSPCDADRHWTLAGCALCHGESKPGALGWLTVEIQSAEVFMIATKSPAPYLTTGVLERTHAGSGSTNEDRKSTRLNSSHMATSYADFCLKKKNNPTNSH